MNNDMNMEQKQHLFAMIGELTYMLHVADMEKMQLIEENQSKTKMIENFIEDSSSTMELISENTRLKTTIFNLEEMCKELRRRLASKND